GESRCESCPTRPWAARPGGLLLQRRAWPCRRKEFRARLHGFAGVICKKELAAACARSYAWHRHVNRLQASTSIAALALFATGCASTQMKNKPSGEEVAF